MSSASPCDAVKRMRFCRHQGLVEPTRKPQVRRLGPLNATAVALVAIQLGILVYWFASKAAVATMGPIVLGGSMLALSVSAMLALVATRTMTKIGVQAAAAADMGMYDLESRIAMGGMGEVWRARHRLLSRPAAVKLIRSREGSGQATGPMDRTAQQRFEREAQVTASLKSPHTVELYDFGITNTGTFYYVMELLEGDDLEQRVKREGPIEPRRVIHILEQTLDSLAEAHRLGLVHRDIKPANLHISERGLEKDFVKVLDFGLVKRSKQLATENSLSHVNTLVGTPAYLAPEAITLDSAIDARTDIYALGCVAYFLLTGHLVFEAESAMAIAVAHVTAKPIPPSKRTRRAIPAELERIVLACLEKSPERRPQSAVALLEMLRTLDGEMVVSERMTSSALGLVHAVS